MEFDVIIIGAGAVGNAIARELSAFDLRVAILEKEMDTGFATSGRNSGVLHAGFNNRTGSLMARFCVEGSQGFEKEGKELGIAFKRTGKLVTAVSEEERAELVRLKRQGEANGTEGLELIDGQRIGRINPHIGGNWALWSPNTGVFDPFAYTTALCEHAVRRGARYFFSRTVSEIRRIGEGERFEVSCGGEVFRCRWLINSAGLYADEICRMVGIHKYQIKPCRGEYHILDKKCAPGLILPVYPVPNPRAGGLGVHLTPTIHGNIMIGPSAEYLGEEEREEYDSTKSVMDMLFEGGHGLLADIKRSYIIRSFAGMRPKLTNKDTGGYADFVIEHEKETGNFISLVGIESPGITASIPIARYVVGLIREREGLRKKSDVFGGGAMAGEEAGGGASSRILCRCEQVSEERILKAYDDIIKIGATPTLRGIKNRTRAGMGRCQGGFCSVKIVELLERKRGADPLSLCWDKEKGLMLSGRVR